MLKKNSKSYRQKFIRRGSPLWLCALALALVLGACNLPSGGEPAEPKGPEAQPSQDLSLLATLTQQALDAESTAPTADQTATENPNPTETQPAPTESSQNLPSVPTEIKFRAGGTLAYLKGDIAAGEQLAWTFGAAAGQTLIAGVSSNDVDVYLEVKGMDDGEILVPFSERSASAAFRLPSTQDYQITLTSPTDNVYFLSVEIPVDLTVTLGAGPVSVDGYVDVLGGFYPDALTRVRYLIYLEEGTTLNVQLKSAALDNLTLALTGKDDGVPYLRYVVKSAGINDLPIPVSQGYYLDVYDVSSQSAEYTLVVEVTE
ncbi:MAG: hypothetical protein P8Y37_09505 [Anaerolineales bacterium]